MCKMCEEADFDWLRVAEASNKKAREAEEAAKPKAEAPRATEAPKGAVLTAGRGG